MADVRYDPRTQAQINLEKKMSQSSIYDKAKLKKLSNDFDAGQAAGFIDENKDKEEWINERMNAG